jgi:signal transduction histidine kinase
MRATLAWIADHRHDRAVRLGKRSFTHANPLWSAVVGLSFAFAIIQLAPAASISSIREIRTLSREDAAEAQPVRISGTCIYVADGECFVHDGKHGIWVSPLTAKSRGLLRDASGLSGLAAGKTVEIEGVADSGGYAPQVLPITIRQTGAAALPEPVKITSEQLIAGSEDGQWVELEGVVQKVQLLADRTVCWLMVDGSNTLITLYGEAGRNLPPLVDARVRAVGAFAPDFNNRGEAVLPKIVSSSPDCIRVIQAPPNDPFARPCVPLNRLRAFSPESSLFHRKLTSGVVTFVRPGKFFFLRDGSTSIRVLSDAEDLQPGWRVDVAGFIALSQHLAALKNGIVRKTGEEKLPPPKMITARDLLRSASWQSPKKPLSSDLSGHNVTLRGRISRVDRSALLVPETVWVEADDIMFSTFLPPDRAPTEKQSSNWQTGAEVELTGTCELIFPGRPDPLGLYDPDGFHVWLASPDDLVVTRPAPWWTPRRLTIALSATGLAALIATGGAALLRRQVKQQVGIIARELETNAIATERERLARDLHDTLEQQLTGVAMQLESLAKSASGRTPEFSNRLTLASRMLQHSREEARRSVWDLRNKMLENHGFAAALDSLAASAAIDGGPQVTTRISGSRAHLPSAITYQLLRMTQEALANALKHAKAENITIHLDMSPQQYQVSIIDDGQGFDVGLVDPSAPPHFGLIGIHERASRIGAAVDIKSSPGTGCTLTITLPLPPA